MTHKVGDVIVTKYGVLGGLPTCGAIIARLLSPSGTANDRDFKRTAGRVSTPSRALRCGTRVPSRSLGAIDERKQVQALIGQARQLLRDLK